MVTEQEDVTEGGEGVGTAAPETHTTVEVPAATKALVNEWCDKVKSAKKHHEKAFKRMRTCMKLAAHGTTDMAVAEAENGTYVVPITNRLINIAVAQLYAKNPKALARRKAKLLFSLWDGDPQTLMAAQQAVMMPPMGPAIDPMTGQPAIDPATGQVAMVPQVDPNAAALVEEVMAAKQEMLLYDRMGKTLGLLFAYFLEEQDNGYKEMFKAFVRRAKVCGVAYVDLGFQRVLEKRPEIDAQLSDATSQVAKVEAMLAQMAEGADGFDDESARAEELRLLIDDLQSKLEIIVREGPVLSFPRATEIIPDEDCHHLKTFAGARWVAREFDMTPARILEVYKVDVTGCHTAYDRKTKDERKGGGKGVCRVWRVQDKENQQVFTICDGYPGFLKAPAEPDVKIERFWTLFALVINEIEDEDEIFPPSDVWNARHMQREYNSAGQGRREHRIAARPRPVAPRGKLEEKDKERIANGAAFELIELNSLTVGEKISDIIGYMQVPGLDQNLYETETIFSDLQRSVGAQEATLGGTSGDTATETSIAEQGRQTSNASDVDDLDTLLTGLARSMGQLMLTELTKETVIEIAGPGAVWPDTPPTREQVVKDLLLTIEAGSTGRPNQAADLAKMERAMPYVLQIPGFNPVPVAKKYAALLDMDAEEVIVEGMPSITAMNQAAGKAAQGAGAGPGEDPNAQGGEGGDNAERPAENEPQSQPAYPAPDANIPSS